jgi:growth arrest-specific protein 8
VKINGNDFMHTEDEVHKDVEKVNRKQKGEFKEEYERNDKGHIGEVNQKEAELTANVNDLEMLLETGKKELIRKFDAKYDALEKELQLRMKVEIHEIEERKNQHINDLMINHEKAFREMKEYFNDITRENLDIIKQLTERNQEVRLQKQMSETIVLELRENVSIMKGPLAIQEVIAEGLRKAVATFGKDKIGYRNAVGSLKDLKTRMGTI